MKVALVEICERTHYMITDALIKTYAELPNIEIKVFTTEEILKSLKDEHKLPFVEFVVKKNKESEFDFLMKIKDFKPERIHYVTISKYFDSFYQSLPSDNTLLFFHFHNIETWFDSGVFGNFKEFQKNVRTGLQWNNLHIKLIWATKQIRYHRKRITILNKFKKLNTYFIALSQAQKTILSQKLDVKKIIIFPSLIFENSPNKAIISDKIRLCIPGTVSNARRDYTGFFESIHSTFAFYKNHVILDLLGYIPSEEKKLANQIIEFEKKGLEVLYYPSFISPEKYDENLAKSDILLSNVIVKLDKENKIQLKETATVFNMIRGAKPGIFPQKFKLDPEFAHSVTYFENYVKLAETLERWSVNRSELRDLQTNAAKLSLEYSPSKLLPRLLIIS